jgi:recombinational DNA repair protein (RecF pathway)
MYALLTDLLHHLTGHPARPLTVFAFEAKLLQELGLSPPIQASRLSPGAQQILGKLIELDWRALACLNPSSPQNHELHRFLHEFLVYHLGKIPRGRNQALAVEGFPSRTAKTQQNRQGPDRSSRIEN